jgi:hypothetical protein
VRRTTSGNRTRPSVVTGGGRGRIRPALPRRKSSQSRPQQDAGRGTTSALRSPTSVHSSQGSQEGSLRHSNLKRKYSTKPGRNCADSTFVVKEPAFALPSSSWQSVDESSDRQPSPVMGTPMQPSGSLVDRDFRSKFLSSATNLPALGRMRKTGSVVRFADEDEEIGIGKGKGKEPARPESPEKLRNRGRTSSQAIDSDDSDEVQLPRSTSQLSMAINDRRKQSGSRDLGPEPTGEEPAPKKSEAKIKDEEILKMGRRAAAPQIPKALPGSDAHDVGYRSPSPGPTF